MQFVYNFWRISFVKMFETFKDESQNKEKLFWEKKPGENDLQFSR